ncbi:uncharacterized protein LOC111193257, partial [Tachysurus ichikawai]
MMADDDVEAFLLTFQVVYHTLEEKEASDYELVRQEILTHCSRSPLNAAGDFHHWQYVSELNSCTYFEDLLRITCRWLQPEILSLKEVIERVLPTNEQKWREEICAPGTKGHILEAE